MSKSPSLGSPSAWFNSAHVEQWLQALWPSWRSDDVRHELDSEGRWLWIVADYQRGRSRVLGMHRSLLDQTTLNKLREVLEDADWRSRIDRDALLVSHPESGAWLVESWSPDLDEKWFETPEGERFVAFRKVPACMRGVPQPDAPKSFLALHGATWSAKGPEDPRPVATYTLEELLPFIPQGRPEAS